MAANERRRRVTRGLTTLAVFAVCTAVVRADVTIVQTTTIEGGMAAMAGQPMSPKITNRIKGLKSRNDVDAQVVQVTTIADLVSKQVIVLRPDQKTAQIVAPPAAGAAGKDAPKDTSATGPAIEGSSFAPTGKSQVIDGVKCEEYAFSTAVNMSEMNMGGGAMPPEAAEMMKGMKIVMKGSVWVARDVPGAADYLAFQKAASAADLTSLINGATGMGMGMPGIDKMMKSIGNVGGLAYLTEMTMTIEGTGQMAEMMQQMGAMKITTKVTSITTDPISDDVFKIPEGYTVIKQ
jgi:hypothetical protein